MSDNPFHPPINNETVRNPVRLTSWVTIRFVLSVGALGLLLGAAAGISLGWLAPEYYQTIFASNAGPNGNANFNPITFGGALGGMQGGTAGVCLGALLAVAQAWLDDKRASRL